MYSALEVHSECQKLTTEVRISLLCALHPHGGASLGVASADHRSAMQAECHAFDGSAMVKMLNETSTAADVQAILASAQAQTPQDSAW